MHISAQLCHCHFDCRSHTDAGRCRCRSLHHDTSSSQIRLEFGQLHLQWTLYKHRFLTQQLNSYVHRSFKSINHKLVQISFRCGCGSHFCTIINLFDNELEYFCEKKHTIKQYRAMFPTNNQQLSTVPVSSYYIIDIYNEPLIICMCNKYKSILIVFDSIRQ